MKRTAVVIFLALVLAGSAPLLAGDHGCKGSTQDCLNKMAAKLRHRGWVGLELEDGPAGEMVVKRVVEDSPAVAAGFRQGDVLVAVNGIEFSEENHEALGKVKQGMAPGKTITYTVARKGKNRDLDVTLGELPDEVLAAWIGGHMLEAHVTVASAAEY